MIHQPQQFYLNNSYFAEQQDIDLVAPLRSSKHSTSVSFVDTPSAFHTKMRSGIIMALDALGEL